MPLTHILRMSRAQQMAMMSILVTYARLKDEPQEFIDVSTDATVTTGELLTLVGDLSESEWIPS